MNFPFTTRHSKLTIPTVSTKPNWKRVCIVLCHETVVKSNNRSHICSLFFIQQFNSMLSTNSSTLDTSSTPTSENSNVQNLHVFVYLDVWYYWDSFLPCEPLLPMVLHLHHSLNVITIWCQIRVQSFRRTHERTALPSSFPGC